MKRTVKPKVRKGPARPTIVPPVRRPAKPADKPNGRGRPTKRTPETIEKLVKYLSEGIPYHLACTKAGITYVVFQNWLNGSMQKDAPQELVDFREEMKKAKNAGELALLERWINHTHGDWRAAERLLTKVNPAFWSDKRRVEHSGPDGGPIQMQGAFIVLRGTEPEFVDACKQAVTAITDGNVVDADFDEDEQ